VHDPRRFATRSGMAPRTRPEAAVTPGDDPPTGSDVHHRPCLLLVEDDDDLRSATATVLTDAGYAVVAARDGAEGLARLRVEPRPALVVLDLMMDGTSGWDFLAAQAMEPALAAIPVVVVSAVAATALLPTPTAAILVKPFRTNALLATCARICAPRPA
jgi:CheY-like chemotaxis protein